MRRKFSSESFLLRFALLVFSLGILSSADAADTAKFEYRVLATTKTSTMEKELNEAADAGFVFASVMGGESAFGGKEVVVVMAKRVGETSGEKNRRYKLLATNKTSTMETELTSAGEEGFDYCGQTVFESGLGGKETSVILEHNPATAKRRIEFRLLATSKTSTMEKELREAGEAGFELVGMTLGKSSFGGKEVISILRKYGE